MKTKLLTFLLFLSLAKLTSGQCLPCGEDGSIGLMCKPVYLVIPNTPGHECPLQICIERMLVCGPEETPCQSYLQNCSIIEHTHSGTLSQLCYLDFVLDQPNNCDCKFVTTNITISRITGNGMNPTITLSQLEIENFMKVLQGNPTTNAFFKPMILTDCEGNPYLYNFQLRRDVSGNFVISLN